LNAGPQNRYFDPRYVEFEPYDDELHHMIVRPGYPSLSKANRPDGSYESVATCYSRICHELGCGSILAVSTI
jgi:hypothetical protein